jgi:hypothetical protein
MDRGNGAAGIDAYSVKNKRYPNTGVIRMSGEHNHFDGGTDRRRGKHAKELL